jgi:hypothetical protein
MPRKYASRKRNGFAPVRNSSMALAVVQGMTINEFGVAQGSRSPLEHVEIIPTAYRH